MNHFPSCMHRHVVLETTGGTHFNAGEAWDDIQERLLCLDCMEFVSEADICTAQSGHTQLINQTQMEVSHDHT